MESKGECIRMYVCASLRSKTRELPQEKPLAIHHAAAPIHPLQTQPNPFKASIPSSALSSPYS